MVDLARLRVSLTKNGYLKIADVLKRHPRWEVLDNVEGVYPGIDVKRSQAANILDEGLDGSIPEFWDAIRSESDATINAFVMVAIIMSHGELIQLLRDSFQGNMKGYMRRDDLSEKAYTNLVFAMASVDACEYVRGSEAVTYDMRPIVYALRNAGNLVQELIRSKLGRAGWRAHGAGPNLIEECRLAGIHRVFGLEFEDFQSWMNGELSIEPPTPTLRSTIRRPR